jgi:hypothetical protein
MPLTPTERERRRAERDAREKKMVQHLRAKVLGTSPSTRSRRLSSGFPTTNVPSCSPSSSPRRLMRVRPTISGRDDGQRRPPQLRQFSNTALRAKIVVRDVACRALCGGWQATSRRFSRR